MRHNKRINERVSNSTRRSGNTRRSGSGRSSQAQCSWWESSLTSYRTNYIEGLQSRFSEHGFRYLIKDGVYFRDVGFRSRRLTRQCHYDALHRKLSGADWCPVGFGVRADLLRASVPSALASAGTVSNDSFTPENLRLSTVADEVAIDGVGLGAVYSIATEPQRAVIMAGHAAKNAVWLNNTTGNWATSSYYGSLPVPVSNRNFRASLSSRARHDAMAPAAFAARWCAGHKRHKAEASVPPPVRSRR